MVLSSFFYRLCIVGHKFYHFVDSFQHLCEQQVNCSFLIWLNKILLRKNTIFVYVRENICRTLKHLWPEIGENPENFQITNQVIPFLVLFFMVFLFISRDLSKAGSLCMQWKIYVGHWGRYCLKEGNPLQNFKSLIKLYFSCFIFLVFLFTSKILSKVRSLIMRGKRQVYHWVSYGLKRGNPIQNVI